MGVGFDALLLWVGVVGCDKMGRSDEGAGWGWMVIDGGGGSSGHGLARRVIEMNSRDWFSVHMFYCLVIPLMILLLSLCWLQ